MNLYLIFSSCRWRAKKKVLSVYIGNFEIHTRYSRAVDEEQKEKKVLGVYIVNFEIHTRYSRAADEEQKEKRS